MKRGEARPKRRQAFSSSKAFGVVNSMLTKSKSSCISGLACCMNPDVVACKLCFLTRKCILILCEPRLFWHNQQVKAELTMLTKSESHLSNQCIAVWKCLPARESHNPKLPPIHLTWPHLYSPDYKFTLQVPRI